MTICPKCLWLGNDSEVDIDINGKEICPECKFKEIDEFTDWGVVDVRIPPV